MYCTNCGQKLMDDANFCWHCGHPVIQPDSAFVAESIKDLVADKAQDIVIQDGNISSSNNITKDEVPKNAIFIGDGNLEMPNESIYKAKGEQCSETQMNHKSTILHRGRIMALCKMEAGIDSTTFFYNYQTKKYSLFYSNASPSDELGRARVEIAGKWGVIDSEFNIIIPALYDYIWPFFNNHAVIKLGNKYGVINSEGKEIFPALYDKIELKPHGIVQIEVNEQLGYKNIAGEDILPLGKYYDYRWATYEGFFAILYHGKYGFIGENGTVIAPIYDDVRAFSNGFAEVLLNGNWYCIDKQGTLYDINSIESHQLSEHNQPYDKIDLFSEGLAAVCKNEQWGYIDENGKIVIKLQYDACENFSEGLAVVCKNDRFGCINKEGKTVIDFIYSYMSGFNCGGAGVALAKFFNVQKGFIDYRGGWIVKWTSSNILPMIWLGRSGIVCNKTVDQFGMIDSQGSLILPIQYDGIECLECDKNILIIQQNNKYGIVNIFGEIISPTVYESIKEIGNSKLSIEAHNEKFIANIYGKQISKLYEDVRLYNESLCAVKLNGKWGFVNAQLQLVIQCIYNDVHRFVNGYTLVNIQGRGILINQNGDEFEYVEDNMWHDASCNF